MPINALLNLDVPPINVDVLPDLLRAAVAHVERHIENDEQANVGDPACFCSRRAIKLAARPISAMDNPKPNIRITGCSRAAPATASTLSSDIDTSAIVICHMAWPSVCETAWGSCRQHRYPDRSTPLWRFDHVRAKVRNSRHIFQHTKAAEMPPASSSPITSSSCTVILAKPIRRMVAAKMPTRIACYAGSRANRRPPVR